MLEALKDARELLECIAEDEFCNTARTQWPVTVRLIDEALAKEGLRFVPDIDVIGDIGHWETNMVTVFDDQLGCYVEMPADKVSYRPIS